jgi:hypothetical protein
MSFWPTLSISQLNGWLVFIAYILLFGRTISTFSANVRRRLYDRILWSRKQRTLTAIGTLISLANMVLVVFTPLAFATPWFAIGSILWLLGVSGHTIAMVNYARTPMDVPVTTGIYWISRNPQIFRI